MKCILFSSKSYNIVNVYQGKNYACVWSRTFKEVIKCKWSDGWILIQSVWYPYGKERLEHTHRDHAGMQGEEQHGSNKLRRSLLPILLSP